MILSMVVVVVVMTTMVMTVVKLMLVAGIPWPQTESLISHIRGVNQKKRIFFLKKYLFTFRTKSA
jgi:hypothetical protein